MSWFVVMQMFSVLLEWVRLGRKSEQEKELEILLLRHQLAILERKQTKLVRASHAEKLILAVLAIKLKARTKRTIKELGEVIRIIQPETVLNWHRELVRRKWTQRSSKHLGRPRTPIAIEELVLRLASENDWGNGKIQGELLKLGHKLSEETIANILKRHGVPPLPERTPSLSWQKLMSHYKHQLLACDFFTVETLFLQTIYVLFFIEVGSRRVHFAGCTSHPKSKWVTQQARQLMWDLEDDEPSLRFLIRDRDTKFTDSFDTVFQSEGIDVIARQFALRMPMPMLNDGYEPYVKNVWINCSLSIRHICNGL